ncbi:quinone-dependent dihydroorotate dehydrogenase [Flavobacteriaceae bacterium Ap0902]|nr:quinone-dependent dihydroorotate dehydrogenase [Flavobacteriaceae bacterium Ap0902]
MYTHIKKVLFKIKPETAHNLSMGMLSYIQTLPFARIILQNTLAKQDPKLKTSLWGLDFQNPIGLAAGFDKDAKYIDELAHLGFSHIEIGTLTPRPQPGNPKPRLFRLVGDHALINRMGFNNGGVDAAVKRLKKVKSKVIIGGNIGKNKTTPNAHAVDDYEYCFRKLYDYVDYFVVNVSSPNTPNLRALQEKEPLKEILNRLQDINSTLGKNRPVMLKIAPDLTNEQLDDIIEIVEETKLAGIVATNTTVNRESLHRDQPLRLEKGGLSGEPLKDRSTEVIKYINQKTAGRIKIIGVGGIFNGEDALEKLNAGASLVQIYTGFIYQGPTIIKSIGDYLIQKNINK